MARYYKIIGEEKLNLAKEFLKLEQEFRTHNFNIATSVMPFENIKMWGCKRGYVPYIKGFTPINLNNNYDGFKLSKDGVFKPNKRTKKGKEIQQKLEQQKGLFFIHLINHMNESLSVNGSFTTPELFELTTKEIVLSCDARCTLDKNNYEEVTFTYVEDNY